MWLVTMVTELSNHVHGVLKVFGLVVDGARGGVFADRVEVLVADRPEVAVVGRPMLEAWRGLRRQVAQCRRAVSRLGRARQPASRARSWRSCRRGLARRSWLARFSVPFARSSRRAVSCSVIV